MSKIKVGAPAVSSYHQIRRLFLTNNSPNYSDHDFPVPNYLLATSGYKILQETTACDGDTDSLDAAQNLINASTYDRIDVRDTVDENNSASSVLDKFDISTNNVGNDLFDIIISQASTELNVKTTKEEILDSFKTERNGQNDILCIPTNENIGGIFSAVSQNSRLIFCCIPFTFFLNTLFFILPLQLSRVKAGNNHG